MTNLIKSITVDASIILKSILNEDQEIAGKFKALLTTAKDGEIEIYSHSLLPLEVGNGLRFALKDKKLAREIYKTFLKLPLKVSGLTKIQQEKVLDLSYELGTTIYDTSYHVLAKSYGAIFVTGDRKYFKKANHLHEIELWR